MKISFSLTLDIINIAYPLELPAPAAAPIAVPMRFVNAE